MLTDAQVKPSSNSQPQAVVQTLQPVAAVPSGTISSMRSRFHWSHAVFAIGLLAVSGAGTAVLIKVPMIDPSEIMQSIIQMFLHLYGSLTKLHLWLTGCMQQLILLDISSLLTLIDNKFLLLEIYCSKIEDLDTQGCIGGRR